ncbi:MAG: hypothetical protein FJ087_06885 [Deltaproteobacteria bacterium]|nr:hypothetical protein [Deltaproteobacteria bacterium]
MRPLCLALVVLALAGTAGCGGTSTCPAGYERHGGVCEPIREIPPAPDPGRDEGVAADAAGDDAPGEVPADAADPDAAEDESGPDLPPADVHLPGGVIGAPCKKDDDCAADGLEAVCLDWVKGYCSVTECGPGGKVTCPVGSVCMAMTAATAACATTCASDAECRAAEGYACKALDDAEGDPVRACWQVKVKHGPGEPCDGAKDCDGAADCLTNFDGGYCAVRRCGEDWPCPGGTHCVKLNGVPTCMKTCTGDPDCQVEGALRTCMPLTSADTGEKVSVCGSGTKGVGLGQICRNDSECTSFECYLAYTGRCSLTKKVGCKAVKDCPSGEICIPSPDDTFGYCTKTCRQTCSHPNLGFCIGGEEKGDGQCLPPCNGAGDPKCGAQAGLECIFGDPIGETGRFACAHVVPGAPGAPCTSGTQCKSGQCLEAPDGDGYCTSGCGWEGYCPFPTRCQIADGQSRCMLRCNSSVDCPKGLTCQVPEGATLDVCFLP